jgi:hypothetical protein
MAVAVLGRCTVAVVLPAMLYLVTRKFKEAADAHIAAAAAVGFGR